MIILVGMALLSLSAGCRGSDSAAGDSLDGTSWVLVTYSKSRPIDGATVTATFEDGQISGSTGCNSYGGSYRVAGDTIVVSKVFATLMACLGEGVMDQEAEFLEFIGDAQTFRLADDQLQIFNSDGEELTFIPGE